MTAERPPAAPPPTEPSGTDHPTAEPSAAEHSTGTADTGRPSGVGPGETMPSAGEPPDAGAPAAGRHLLVLPDRDAAEELAEELADLLGLAEPPVPLREALAGEDDAEDAQWLLVLEDPDGRHDPRRLAGLAEDYEGWLERE